MTTVSIFTFRTTEVRTVERDGQAWFVASDIAKALEYAEAKDMTRWLDADEADRHIVPIRSENGVEQDREVTIINESGLYHALFKSRKKEAQDFRKWVTSEVLPAIRKTGSYTATPYAQNPTDTLTVEQCDILRKILTDAAAKLPKEKQGGLMVQGWSKLKAHFKCGYRQIPQAEFTEAVSIVARHVAENTLPATLGDGDMREMAHEALIRCRYTLTFGLLPLPHGGKTLAPMLYPIPEGAFVIRPDEIAQVLAEPGVVPRSQLPGIISAAAARLSV